MGLGKPGYLPRHEVFGGIDQGSLGDPHERPIRDFTRVLMRITKSVHNFTLPLSQYP